MLTQPLATLLPKLSSRDVYVWVSYSTPSGPVNRSIRIDTLEAIRWAKNSALDLDGHVPCFVGQNEIFLGGCPGVDYKLA